MIPVNLLLSLLNHLISKKAIFKAYHLMQPAVIVGFKEFQVVFTVSSFVGNPVNINIINMLPAVGI